MGIYDRDYYRAEPAGVSLFGGSGAVCKRIIAATILVFVAQLVTLNRGQDSFVTEWLQLTASDVLHGQIWRLITYAFCHDPFSIWHILFNMYFFWIIGPDVEQIYGSREFFKFYLAAAAMSGLGFLAVGLITAGGITQIACIGASGAVSATLVVCAMHYPKKTIMFFLVIPVEFRFLVWIFLILDLHPVLLGLTGTPVATSVAHSAHLGGMLYGFLYMKYDLRFSRLFGDLSLSTLRKRWRMSRTPVRIYQPTEEPANPEVLEQQVDAILAKITAHGESSLTEAERAVLKEASRRYKGKI